MSSSASISNAKKPVSALSQYWPHMTCRNLVSGFAVSRNRIGTGPVRDQ
jgi:hypothetical protein